VCNHLFIGENFLWLVGKANQDQPLDFKDNFNHSFANLKTKHRKIDLWIKRMIVNHLIEKDGLLGERVFNFQIGHLLSTITIRLLKN